jgi:5-methylcytosine-specific restriction endonuclease McrA
MPMRPPSLRACGCVVAYGERCQHMLAADRARKARHDENRPTSRQRGYDSKWAKARAGFLAKHPYCARCGAPATVVHHSVPHRGNRAIFWDRSKWVPACQPCHDGPLQSAERRAP